ncbi:hypothetical protein [Paracoccus sp. S-4012]|uniref:hypothetical protein n=1 Tax=Paracoccus sp. S-4012 TaxID=2665648 RepID=UPI001E456527|nr:hypothetical protein [Paracoccus sp. S-4012]
MTCSSDDVTGRLPDGRRRVRIGGREVAVPGRVESRPAWLCLHARDLVPQPGGFPSRVSAARYEDGYHVADILLDDLPEAGPLTLRLDARAATGDAIEVGLRGGWMLPREGASPLLAARRTELA